MKTLVIIASLVLFTSCSEDIISKFDFLTGTWKMEGKEQYETWTRENKNELSGHSYRISDNQEIFLESIAIKLIDDQIVYEAMVPDQNNGNSVQFALNNEITSYFSFENSKHDFPKKIQYHKLSENVILIRVLGEDNEGFSYTLFKQDTK